MSVRCIHMKVQRYISFSMLKIQSRGSLLSELFLVLCRCCILYVLYVTINEGMHDSAGIHMHTGLVADNYCTVVKHHYSFICPLAPSVLLSATLYTISTTPRTNPPTHIRTRTRHPFPCSHSL